MGLSRGWMCAVVALAALAACGDDDAADVDAGGGVDAPAPGPDGTPGPDGPRQSDATPPVDATPPADAPCLDEDGDGLYGAAGCGTAVDCDDTTPALYQLLPGRPDLDGDGYAGGPEQDVCSGYALPPGYTDVSAGDDCDDTRFFAHPDMVELADTGAAVDDDCAGGALAVSDATGVFVSATTGDDGNPGTMAEPKATIGAGILAATGGRVVFVAAGSYDETVTATTSLFGGYDPGDWSRDIDANVTTINGGPLTVSIDAPGEKIALQGFAITGTDTPGAVLCGGVRAVDGTVAVMDSTVTGGTCSSFGYGVRNEGGTTYVGRSTVAAGATDAFAWGVDVGDRAVIAFSSIDGGGAEAGSGLDTSSTNGVRLGDAASSAFVHQCEIDGGIGTSSASGVFTTSGALRLTHNDIYGGGVAGATAFSHGVDARPSTGTAELFNNVIRAGEGSQTRGIRLDTDDSGAILAVNNYIHGGNGSFIYWGINSFAGEATLINNTIVGQNGVIVWGGPMTLVNNQIYAEGGTGLFIEVVQLELHHNNVWGPSISCAYEYEDDLGDNTCAATIDAVDDCSFGGCTAAAGNRSEDPLFAAPPPPGRLTASSPNRNAGTSPQPWLPSPMFVDADGTIRHNETDWDIGFDEL